MSNKLTTINIYTEDWKKLQLIRIEKKKSMADIIEDILKKRASCPDCKSSVKVIR